MRVPTILMIVALVFAGCTLWRLWSDGFKLRPASRTWLLVALIFGAVSGWLWWSGAGTPPMAPKG
jgi:hypothetical protein